jgi:hypothetical protein
MAAATNEYVNTANSTLVGLDTIAFATKQLFTSNPINTVFGQQDTGISALAGGAILASAKNSIENITVVFENCIKVINSGKISGSLNVSSSIWDLAKNIIFALQSQAVQLADETLSKVIDPIEEQIKDWVPTECGTRGYAWQFFKKIIDGLSREKQWILQQIQDLFTSGTDFADNHRNFTAGSMSILEIEAFLLALKMISFRFGDLAIACGIQPCSEDALTAQGTRVAQAIKTGNTTSSPPLGSLSVINTIPTRQNTTNIDEIADSFAGIIDLSKDNVIVDKNSISTVYSLGNMPVKIKELMDLNSLGSNYGVFDDGNETKVVYTFNRMCGV